MEKEKVSFVDVYTWTKQQLKNAGIFDASELDFLICEAIGVKRGELPLIKEITKKQKESIESATKRRICGEPITKIFGRTEFYGYNFIVTNDVLSPRQETEILVENVLKFAKSGDKILDLCTGSGIIAISLAKNVDAKITASDISIKALDVAKQNANINNVNIDFLQSNLFENLKSDEKFDIVVSNPPYIATKDIDNLDKEVKDFDPLLALDGGCDGLKFYREIIEKCPKFLTSDGMLFLEIGYNQKNDVINLLQKDFENIVCKKDYQGQDRVIFAKLKQKGKEKC